MARSTRRTKATLRTSALRALGLGAALTAASCDHSLDTTRIAPPRSTLGEDMYGALCDRVGASSFAEDLAGASYAGICHHDAEGKYRDTVDETALPAPSSPDAARARRLSIAKLERLARRRGDLVRALDATFPDVEIDDLTKASPTGKVRLHDALATLAQSLTVLYEQNPIEPGKDPLIPRETRALGRLFDTIGGNDAVLRALSRVSGRRGYRPFHVGLGAVRPMLAYPRLRDLTASALAQLAPGGGAARELQQALGVLRQEMLTFTPTLSPLPDYQVAPATAQPNRPREAVELAAALLLRQDPAFSTGTGPLFIARRDRRGLVVPHGNTPGVKGTVKAPFVDLDGDGYADVDAFSRFVGADGAPLAVDTPFVIPGLGSAAADGAGRPPAGASTFTYVDTSTTLVAGLSSHLVPLLDPLVVGTPGQPDNWQDEHETLMYAIAGGSVLFGDRLPGRTYDYGADAPGGAPVTFTGFDPDTSPLPDLVHAAGQVLADEDSDALLLGLVDLLEHHESTVARLVGAALRLREIAKEHDAKAAAGTEPLASLDYATPIWDELAQVAWKATKKPGLVKALLGALADPSALEPIGNATDMGDALAKFVTFKDRLTYDPRGTRHDGSPGGVNGPAINLTVDPNGHDTSDPRTPVDVLAPHTGDNISCMQRSLALIDHANGGPACNKDGAKIAVQLAGIDLVWPLVGKGYAPCEVFRIENLSTFYLDSLLPIDHPRRALLDIRAPDLGKLLDLLGGIGVDQNALLEQSSDIKGFTLHPDAPALNRFVFFGASDSAKYPGMPDVDAINIDGQTNRFISSVIDPISSAYCPPGPNGSPSCAAPADTMRLRDPGTIFLWERFGFTKYLAPIVKVLADAPPQDGSGEALFNDVVHVLNRHWPGPDHGEECQSSDPDQPLYCSGAGLNRYEPLLADAFHGDVVAAVHELAEVATTLSKIKVARGPKAGQEWTGADVIDRFATLLFSQDYAKKVGMVDRKGSAKATWVDGTPQPQLTVFNLFADALHGIDLRFEHACDGALDATACKADVATRHGQWLRARSQLTDEFLAVDGSGAGATFRNRAVVPTLVSVLRLAREQVNAHCPEREHGKPCAWARKDLADKVAGVMRRPMFAAFVDLVDKLRQDEPSRRELETFLQHLLRASDGESLQSVLSSIADMAQLLSDDADLSPLLAAAAPAASPDADPAGPGAVSLAIGMLKALTDDAYDPQHVVNHVLPNLVTPMDDGTNLSPIEIFMDVAADVNRVDASDSGPFAPADYAAVMTTMKDLMLDSTRGLEQYYTIIQQRPRP